VEGTLNNNTPRLLYVFAGRAGEILSVQLETLEGDLDLRLLLLNAQGALVAVSDDEGAGLNPRLEGLRLTADGDYFLVVARFGDAFGTTSGRFRLTLEREGAALGAGALLRYGDSAILGEIMDTNPQVVYWFQGARGDVVNLRLRRASGNLDPFLDLATAQGQILRSSDDDASDQGTLNAAILNFTLPSNGLYLIVATRYGRELGTTTGAFLLSLEAIPESQRGLAPSNAILLDYGQRVGGALDNTMPQRFYTFQGRRGEVIRVEMERERGNLDALLLVFDADLRELARASASRAEPARALIPTLTLPADGVYYLMATRQNFTQGLSSGEFSLLLEGRMGLAGSSMLEIFYDSDITGRLDDSQPFENFIFQGRAGEIITLRLEATSGNLDPLLTLYRDEKQIAFDDDSAGNKNAEIRAFRLPADGLYRVEVSRYDRAAGATTGDYRLTLTRR
jgi:hypothetical protein